MAAEGKKARRLALSGLQCPSSPSGDAFSTGVASGVESPEAKEAEVEIEGLRRCLWR